MVANALHELWSVHIAVLESTRTHLCVFVFYCIVLVPAGTISMTHPRDLQYSTLLFGFTSYVTVPFPNFG